MFEGRIGSSGTIAVPAGIRKALADRRLSVRVIPSHEARALEAAGVTEDELDEISAVQSESRGQVIRFLLSEGALARKNRTRARRR